MGLNRVHNRMPAYSHAIELVAKDIDKMVERMIAEHGLANVPTVTFHGSRAYRDALTTTIQVLGVKARRKGVRGDIVIDVASWCEVRHRMAVKKANEERAEKKALEEGSK